MAGTAWVKADKKHSITFESEDGVQAFKELITWMENELPEVSIDHVISKQENERFTILVFYHKRPKGS